MGWLKMSRKDILYFFLSVVPFTFLVSGGIAALSGAKTTSYSKLSNGSIIITPNVPFESMAVFLIIFVCFTYIFFMIINNWSAFINRYIEESKEKEKEEF
jgi:hypothetical protein